MSPRTSRNTDTQNENDNKRVLSELSGTVVHPSDGKETFEVADAVARVAIHTPSAFDGPDAFVLCSSDGLPSDDGNETSGSSPKNLRPQDFSFYQKVAVADSAEGGGGSGKGRPSVVRKSKKLKVAFVPSKNEGTAELPETDPEKKLDKMRFTLFWAPTGDPNTERIAIAEGVPGEKAWADTEETHFIAHFVATKFAEACEVALPEETPPSYDDADPIRTEAPALDFLGEDEDEEEEEDEAFRFAKPVWPSATPVESRPVSTGTKNKPAGSDQEDPTTDTKSGETTGTASTESSGSNENGSNNDGQTNESASFERPPGPRWVHLFRVVDPLGEGGDSDIAMDSDVLGVYRVTKEGEYKRAKFNSQGRLEVVVDDAQTKVLVPIDGGAFSTKRHVSYARLSGFKVPEWRVQDLRKRLAFEKRPRDQQAGVMPLRVTAATLTDGMADGGLWRDATNYDSVFAGQKPEQENIDPPLTEEPFWTLPHPLSIAERRLGWAEQAYDRLQKWNDLAGSDPMLTGPMTGTCHDPDQNRTYLADQLTSVEEKANDMGGETNWGKFSHKAVPEDPPGETALAHFQHGARCQRTYLRLQWRRATQAFDRLAEGGLLTHDVAVDALASKRKKKGETKQTERLFALFPRLQAIGGGTAMPAMMKESGLFKEMARQAEKSGEHAGMAKPLDAVGKKTLKDDTKAFVTGSGFKLLFKLAQESTKTAQHLFAQGTVTGAVSWSGSAELVESHAKNPPAAFEIWARLLDGVTDGQRSPSEVHDVTSGTAEKGGKHGRIQIGSTIIRRTGGSKKAVPWEIKVSLDMEVATERWMGQSTSNRLASASLKRGGTAAGGVLSALDVLLGTYTLWANQQEGTLGMADGARVGKVAAGVAGSVDAGMELSGSFKTIMKELVESGAARRVGRFLARTFPIYLEGIMMGINIWEQSDDKDARGLQVVSDPNYIGMFGAAVRGIGGILGAAAFAAGAWPLVAAGAALYAGGQILIWIDANMDQIQKELNDPLTGWLPTDTIWGEDVKANREPFFQLVRPGSLKDKKSLSTYSDARHGTVPKRLKAELDGFAKKGFSFPTRGHAAPPDRVQQVHTQGASPPPRYKQEASALEEPKLRIVPRYLPAEGTLLVNAEIIDATQEGTVAVPVKCAVHYVSIGGNFRYKVMPVGEGREAHPLAVDERRSLTHAVDQTWGESVERDVTLSVTEQRSRKRVDTTTGGKPTVVYDQYAVERTKTLRQEVMELKLVDESVPTAPEPTVERPSALSPEDVYRTATEPDATGAAQEELPGEPPSKKPPISREQTVPVPGLGEVLESRSEGILTIGSGKNTKQVRYDGPRFEIRGGVYFQVDEPVAPAPKLPKGTAPQSPDKKLPDYIAAMDIEYVYPGDELAG